MTIPKYPETTARRWFFVLMRSNPFLPLPVFLGTRKGTRKPYVEFMCTNNARFVSKITTVVA